MARGVNKAFIIGNLGSDPEVRSTSNGTKVATLSIATTRRWTSRDGEQQEDTQWHRVVCWDRLAEICEEYLSKGDKVYIEGRIEYRQWEGDDGRTRYTTEIRAREMEMLGSPGGGRGGGQPSGGSDRPEPDVGDGGGDEEDFFDGEGDDDLPF